MRIPALLSGFLLRSVLILGQIKEESMLEKRKQALLLREEIKATWRREWLDTCIRADLHPNHYSTLNSNLLCHQRLLTHSMDVVKLEVLNRRPAIIRIPDFLPSPNGLKDITQLMEDNKNAGELSANEIHTHTGTTAYRTGHGPCAFASRDGDYDHIWFDLLEERALRPLYNRLERLLRINPITGENFVVSPLCFECIIQTGQPV